MTELHSIERSLLIEQGFAVYQVRDVYGDEDQHGASISPSEQEKWFVAVRADSSFAAMVPAIPLAVTEVEAWDLAAQLVAASMPAFRKP